MAGSVAVAVQDSVEHILPMLRHALDGLKVGATDRDPDAQMGPVVTRQHLEKILACIDQGLDAGADLYRDGRDVQVPETPNGFYLGPTIFDHTNTGMTIVQEEIFGPVLPVKTYRAIDEVIDYVNAHDRPLGLYYFGQDKAEAEKVLTRTISGGVTVNDVIFHVSADDLPFGGIGPSGMGSYHGVEGFRTFSHARAVYRQPKVDLAKLAGLRPPYGAATQRTLKMQLK